MAAAAAAVGGGVKGMDIEKIHGVSGSLLTEVLRHQVALAQVRTQDRDERKRERLERGERFRNIPERNPVVIVPCEHRVRGCATAGGLSVSQHVTRLISNNNDDARHSTITPPE